jgi:hypothetical protein
VHHKFVVTMLAGDRVGRRLRRALVVACLVLIVLAEWIMWEAVVKPLKDCCPSAWSRGFPAPFYLWEAPIWLWHDLSIALVVVSSAVLAYLALSGECECR